MIERVPEAGIEVPDGRVQVVQHQASAEEQGLDHAAVAALCARLRRWIDELPAAHASTLTQVSEGRSSSADGLGLAVAFRTLLHTAARSRPLLLVVQRAHLLDRGSAAAIGFAARSADSAPLGVLVTQDPAAPGRLELPFAPRCPHVGPTWDGPAADPDTPARAWVGLHRWEIRLLGGLQVRVDGQPLDLPAGAASTAVAVVALRRGVHVEELASVLWPEASPEVSRRRLRNVLARIRHATGEILVRRGDRIVLADGVGVDHHELEVAARRALALPPGPERAARLAEVLCAHTGPLLPEAAYEEWAQAARRRSEVRSEELAQALAAERDGR